MKDLYIFNPSARNQYCFIITCHSGPWARCIQYWLQLKRVWLPKYSIVLEEDTQKWLIIKNDLTQISHHWHGGICQGFGSCGEAGKINYFLNLLRAPCQLPAAVSQRWCLSWKDVCSLSSWAWGFWGDISKHVRERPRPQAGAVIKPRCLKQLLQDKAPAWLPLDPSPLTQGLAKSYT